MSDATSKMVSSVAVLARGEPGARAPYALRWTILPSWPTIDHRTGNHAIAHGGFNQRIESG